MSTCPICKNDCIPFVNKPELLLYGTCESCLYKLERQRVERKRAKSDGREYEDHNWLK